MFEIDKITCYKTKDGKLFETYEEAEKHNKALIEKEVPFDEFSIYDVYGTPISIDDYRYAWYVYAKTDNGAKFLECFINEHNSLEEDIKIEPGVFYRYDGDEERWISQKEDLDRLSSCWGNLIKFEEADLIRALIHAKFT